MEEKQREERLLQEGICIGVPAVAIALVFIITVIGQILIDMIVRRTVPEWASANWYDLALSSTAMYVIAMPLAALLFRLAPTQAPEKRRMKPYVFLGLLTLCFGITYAGNIVGFIVNRIIGAVRGEPVINEVASITIATPLWANLLFIGILAPVMEELIYRKLLIDRLAHLGDLPAILISGVSFGLIHGNFSQFFYATAVGLLFGYIYINTGKLRYTLLLHMAINLIGGVALAEVSKLSVIAPTAPLTVILSVLSVCFFVLTVVGAIVAAVLFLIYCRRPLRRAEVPLRAREWCAVLLANPAVWLFLAVSAVLFAA